MKRVLILDTETTGLDPAVDKCIEVAAILYSIEHATVLQSFGSLIWQELPRKRALTTVAGEGPLVGFSVEAETTCPYNPAEAINRIQAEAVLSADDAPAVFAMVRKLAERADAIVAHSAEFDRGFLPSSLREIRPWVCSKDDIRWPKQTRERPHLVSLALEHDLGVAYAHRAMADCDLIARLLTRSRELGCDLQEMFRLAMRPKGLFVALVSYHDRNIAKDAGFAWDPEKKEWWRWEFLEEAGKWGFQVRRKE